LIDFAKILYAGALWDFSSREMMIESHISEMSGARLDSHFQYLNRYNSAADRWISLKCDTKFYHVTADDTLRTSGISGKKAIVRNG